MTARVKASSKLAFSKREEPKDDAKRIYWFEVDDVEYTMPADIPTGYAISLLTVVHGLSSAVHQGAYLIRELAGPAALTALLASDMTGAQWKQVVDKGWPHVFGPLEEDEPGK